MRGNNANAKAARASTDQSAIARKN
jgi:hypothetical protein